LSIYPGGVDRLSAALMGSCAYCERLSILGEFELLHALASVVLSLCLFLEEPVLCHCMTVLSPASFLRGHALLIGCVEPLPMSLGTDFWLWFVSFHVILRRGRLLAISVAPYMASRQPPPSFPTRVAVRRCNQACISYGAKRRDGEGPLISSYLI